MSLIDEVPQIVWTASPSGAIEYVNAYWKDFYGFDPVEAHADRWLGIVHPEDVARITARWKQSLDDGTPYEIEVRCLRRDGAYRWMSNRAIAVRDTSGEIAHWTGVSFDVHERKIAERSLSFLSEAGKILAASLDLGATLAALLRIVVPSMCDGAAINILESDGRLRTAALFDGDPAMNERARILTDAYLIDPSAKSGSANVVRTGVAETLTDRRAEMRSSWRDATAAVGAGRDAYDNALVLPLTFEKRTIGTLVCNWLTARANDPNARALLDDIAVRAAAAIAHAQLHATVVNEERRYRDLERRQRFLADASRALGDSLDVAATLETLVRLPVPIYADWCLINVVGEVGDLEVVAVHHANPTHAEALRSLIGFGYLDPAAQYGSNNVVRSGRSEVSAHVDPQGLHASVRREYLSIVLGVGVSSTLVVPIVVDGSVRGTLLAVYSGDREYGDDDRLVFEDLALRAGAALGNAAAYQREHRVAAALQRASLPASLPSIPGVHFDGVYRAGADDAQIGGDWYDAMRLADGRIVVSIGDVAGSGLDAAVMMGNVRQIIRGIAQVHADPALMLDAADKALRNEYPERYVTAFVGVFDPVTSTLTFACAGHPPPFVRNPDGTLVELTCGGLPLGLRGRDEQSSQTIEIAPNSIVVLYTDGLTESTRNASDGEQKLRRAVTDRGILESIHPAAFVHQSVLAEGASRDDIAILTMAIAPGDEVSASPDILRWRFGVEDGVAAQKARRECAAFLQSRGLRDDDLYAAEMIFGELVGNVVRYAPGPIEVILDWTGESPVLHVLDQGPGFQHIAKLPTDVMSERGRGLFLIASLADDFHVSRRIDRGSHARAVLTTERLRALTRRTTATASP